MTRRIPFLSTVFAGVLLMALMPSLVLAQTPVAPVANPCQRFTAGSVIHNPPALFSTNGVLNVQFSYQQTTDSVGRQLFCFMTPNGLENPTLYVKPGDTLNVTVTNNTPNTDVSPQEAFNPPTCGDTEFVSTPLPPQPGVTTPQGFPMTGGSMNIHYHGTNTTPQCHGDNVVKTLVNPGNTFQYSLQFPTNEPPGLYWYHPHVHGLAEAAVQGGGEGALVVEGISDVQPAVGGLEQRIIIIRDQQFNVPNISESGPDTEGGIPQHDLSVNFVPLDTAVNVTAGTATYTPAVVQMESGEAQLWRICNCTSDAPLDLAVRFDGVNQTFQVAGIDAVPVNSQDGTQPGRVISVTHVRIPPASRYEIIVNAPPSTVKVAQLVTQLINSGPQGDNLPTRPLLNIQVVPDSDDDFADSRLPAFSGTLNTSLQRFGGIDSVTPAVERTVFFEEVENGTAFFMSTASCFPATDKRCIASGPPQIDVLFNNNNAPAIVTTQGTVELWHVQNHARENHELHQHQIHFKVKAQLNFDKNNSQPAPAILNQFLDMVEVPFCNGPAPANPPNPPACVNPDGTPAIPYPQVDALMDFRGPDIGDFVFHCHILGHEDLGMMAIERVVSSLP